MQETVTPEPPERDESGRQCLNCGAGLSGAFCTACGQSGDVRPEPLLRFLRTGVEELLSLEGRFLRGIRHLATRPGSFTLEYHRGRRTQHLHPFRLLLVVAAIVGRAAGVSIVTGILVMGPLFMAFWLYEWLYV